MEFEDWTFHNDHDETKWTRGDYTYVVHEMFYKGATAKSLSDIPEGVCASLVMNAKDSFCLEMVRYAYHLVLLVTSMRRACRSSQIWMK